MTALQEKTYPYIERRFGEFHSKGNLKGRGFNGCCDRAAVENDGLIKAYSASKISPNSKTKREPRDLRSVVVVFGRRGGLGTWSRSQGPCGPTIGPSRVRPTTCLGRTTSRLAGVFPAGDVCACPPTPAVGLSGRPLSFLDALSAFCRPPGTG